MVAVSDEDSPAPKGRRHRPESLPPASGEESTRPSLAARSTDQPRSAVRSTEAAQQTDAARSADPARSAPVDNSAEETAAHPKVTWS
jgi:hypothetical protein